MNKRTFIFLLAVIFSVPVLFSQQYVFYHFKEKKVLKTAGNYISVKLGDNTIQSAKNEISRTLQSYIKKETNFTAVRENFNKSEVIIAELKDNLNQKSTGELIQKLASMNQVVYIGYGFSSGDKVIHFTTNEIIVRFKGYVSTGEINSFNNLFKTRIIEKVSGMDNVYLLAVESNGADGKDNVFDAANKFAMTSLVEYSQPNFIRCGMIYENAFSNSPHTVPNDTMLNRMWHIKNTGNNIPEGVMGTPGCDMNVIPAWDITKGNPNILISIVDTGIDTNHTDLRNQLSSRTLWYDAYDNDQKPYDEYYHGTGVSGTAIAEGNNIAGTVGVAYGCKVLPVRVFGPYPNAYTTDLILAKGLNWAWQKGAAVINCSWGGGVPAPTVTQSIQDANRFGRNGKGTIVFGGAGNDDTDIVIYPASMEEVVGVGGLSPCNERKSKVSCDNVSMLQDWGACFGEGM